MFQAIARHLFVLTVRWIRECLKQRQVIDESPFEMRGDLPYGDYHDGMRHSRLSKHYHLFEHCQFYLHCHGCQDKMVRVSDHSIVLNTARGPETIERYEILS